MLDDVNFNIAGGLDFGLPRMARVRQKFEHHAIDDVAAAVAAQLARPEIKAKVKPGAKIAVGVGSRGVANIGIAVKALVGELKKLGAEPFVFPAMGSHGGGTVKGQVDVLTGYGVTEAEIGAPVRATMDTVVAATMDDGTPIHMDKFAHEADGVVIVNRVKPHTNFRGSIESGVVKMLIIGMGKIAGATVIHSVYGMDKFGTVLPVLAERLVSKIPYLFGVALVEDSYDDTAIVEAIPVEEMISREAELQSRSKKLMGRLYIDDIDVLVIDEIGKNISGAGCDPNITGRNMRGVEGFDLPRVNKLVVFDLTDATNGNATGFGSADVITQRLLGRINFSYTYANIVTSCYLDGAKIPLPMKNGEEAVRLAVKTLIGTKPEDARIIRIKNTLELGEIQVSEPLLEEIRRDSRMEILSDPADMVFEVAA